MTKTKQLVIIGNGETAHLAYEYFTFDSPYEVVAFSVERQYLSQERPYGLPLVALDELETRYPPATHEAFVAVSFTQLNRVRMRLFEAAKNKGYRLASYLSSRASCWHDAVIGENCFIFEHNTIQPFVRIGDNVVLWSGSHIGHRVVIHDHCFIASQVVLCGYAEIGEGCFIGVNACVTDNVKVAPDCWIGPGVIVTRDTLPDKLFAATPARPANLSVKKYFRATP